MRRKLVAANWKMNGDDALIETFLLAQNKLVASPCDVLVCPPATLLRSMAETFRNTSILIGGQNCHHETDGAFTGEISAEHLRQCGATHVILGHSERRLGQGEDSETIARKVRRAREVGLHVILCIGETHDQRESGLTLKTLKSQLERSLPSETFPSDSLTVAYEPVWAIGTGHAASSRDISEAHSFLRQQCIEVFGGHRGHHARILYGGSMTPDNAAGIMALPDVDGGLIGGASLNPGSFARIAAAAGG